MDRLRLAAMALCCCIALSAAAGRSLQQSWDQALKQSLQAIDQAAWHVFSQVAMTAAASSVVDKSVPLQNKTIDDINEYAPVFKTDMGYFIRPQVCADNSSRQLPNWLLCLIQLCCCTTNNCFDYALGYVVILFCPAYQEIETWEPRGQVASALHNAAEGLGPVHVLRLGPMAAPPKPEQRAPAPAPGSSRRLLAVPSTAAPAPAPSYAANGPVAAVKALVLAAWAPNGPPQVKSFKKKGGCAHRR